MRTWWGGRRLRTRILIGLLATGLVMLAGFWGWLTSDLPPIGNLQAGLAYPSTRILDRHGRLLYEILAPTQGRHVSVPFEAIPQHCVNAAVATEDANFYRHPGVDPFGIARALWINIRGGDVLAGGSTITQQVARITLLSPHAIPDRSLKRKLQEAVLALRLETAYSKDDVLGLYLNQAYFGSLAYGIEAAARAYFGKNAPELSLSECALLVGLLQAPAAYDPLRNPDVARTRQGAVLRLMVENGYLTQAQADTAARDILYYASTPFPIEAPHFVMSVWAQLERDYPDHLYVDGLDVVTTLDLSWQQAAEVTAREQLAILNDPRNPNRPPAGANNAALVALDPRTGEVLAMLGSPDYFDESISGAVNATLALRQPGSALKPLTYAAAMNPRLANVWTPATVVLDVATTFFTRKGEPYAPANYGFVEHGPVSVREALASSYNIPAVAALQHAGVPAMIGLSARAGLQSLADNSGLDLAVTLGGGEVRLLDLTAAYAMFARGGTTVTPIMITRVSIRDGETLYAAPPTPAGERLLDPRVAWLISDILSDDRAREGGFGRDSLLNIGRPAAAKTGTTTDYRDNWVVGYTPSLVVGVWVGNADNRAMTDATGLSGAGPIWHYFMRRVLSGTPRETFTRPDGLEQVEICVLSGLLPTPDCPERRNEWFIAGTAPTAYDDYWHRLDIDTRTGTLAEADTPPEYRGSQLFVTLPTEAEGWARREGLRTITADRLTAYDAEKTLPVTPFAALRIITPSEAMAYRITPSMPRASQRLRIEAAAPANALRVRLLLDGVPIGKSTAAPHSLFWTLEAGIHTLVAEADMPDGETLTSSAITFRVLDVDERE